MESAAPIDWAMAASVRLSNAERQGVAAPQNPAHPGQATALARPAFVACETALLCRAGHQAACEARAAFQARRRHSHRAAGGQAQWAASHKGLMRPAHSTPAKHQARPQREQQRAAGLGRDHHAKQFYWRQAR